MSIAAPTPRSSTARFQRKAELPRDARIEALEAQPLFLQRDAGEIVVDAHFG